jgi:DNA-binding PadR family transcriptional regulator
VRPLDWRAFFGSMDPWFGAFAGARGRFFEAGEVRLAILSLLAEGPKHGYQLMKEMAERSGGIYRASAGSVYPTLQQLEDEGLIASDQKEGRRVYHLTAAGRKELNSDPDAVRRIWERAEQWEDWGNSMGPEMVTTLVPAAAVLKSALRASGRVAGKPDREQKLRDILERARKELDAL